MIIGVLASEPFSVSKLQSLLSFLFAMGPKKDQVIKVEPKDSHQEKRDQANMANQLRNSSDPNKQQILALYQSLPRFDKQKKELLAEWKKDKSCKWAAAWSKRVTASEMEEVKTRTGFGTKFQVAEMLEIPADSKEFSSIEKQLMKEGLCDDEWDETIPVQNAYKKAGLKRWDLSKVTATWGTLSTNQGWKEDIALEAQGSSSGSQKQLTSVLGAIGKSALEPGQQRDPDFDEFTNQVTTLASLKGQFFLLWLIPVSFCFSPFLGQVAGRRRSTKPRTLLPDFLCELVTSLSRRRAKTWISGAQTRPWRLASWEPTCQQQVKPSQVTSNLSTFQLPRLGWLLHRRTWQKQRPKWRATRLLCRLVHTVQPILQVVATRFWKQCRSLSWKKRCCLLPAWG